MARPDALIRAIWVARHIPLRASVYPRQIRQQNQLVAPGKAGCSASAVTAARVFGKQEQAWLSGSEMGPNAPDFKPGGCPGRPVRLRSVLVSPLLPYKRAVTPR